MIIVPDILQRLVQHYGIDAKMLSEECLSAERVRTRTWLAGSNGTSRTVLESLPSAFPPFKGHINEGILRVEMLKLASGVMFESRKRISRIKMPWPNIPEIVISASVDRPLEQLIGVVSQFEKSH